MKKWFRAGLVFLLAFTLIWLSGCDQTVTKEKDTGYVFYYTNQSKSELLTQPYEPVSDPDDTDAMIQEFLNQMTVDPDSVDYWKVLPDSVKIESYELDGTVLTLDFNSAYSEMDSALEILCRGAISNDLLQIPGIAGVRFLVDGNTLRDSNGMAVGLMTDDSFVLDTNVDVDNIEEAEITLYFASLDGQGLVKKTQTVRYSSSKSIEKVVMERLIAGPGISATDCTNSLPAGTNLISVSVMEGVCFVNLDDNFMNQDFAVSENVVIYSIVDSLTELDSVDTVQISVNGDTNRTYRDKISLSESFVRNMEYVVN